MQRRLFDVSAYVLLPGAAQGFELRKRAAERGAPPMSWDAARTARLGGFGLFFYGPLMHYWYGALNTAFPVDRAWTLAAKLPPFLTKARWRPQAVRRGCQCSSD